ncbi:phospholipase D NDAI_0B05150 [Naumovozyma dairenensis CBS 421]|uniref:Phospholipase D1 n=1 Tax=Naumovozyma dairenensis (strain ATCC 10597 / BCRC 20456 / CBS 421 / NBRC 0211 / NRRL Y-12639) TaxID=1071378 RepID=G0W6Y7_NAUDC|nr:hypothetical protein NDAI_0B05150 [Naumovozyma dairenensis CBS 421]CCD23548.1 hypothetical protein NDAI_0B05150 [Naumovozyma dairenensis CBS 421]
MGPQRSSTVIPGISPVSRDNDLEEVRTATSSENDLETNTAANGNRGQNGGGNITKKNYKQRKPQLKSYMRPSASGSLLLDDDEGNIKNLSFQGVPNSARTNDNKSMNQFINDEQDPLSHIPKHDLFRATSTAPTKYSVETYRLRLVIQTIFITTVNGSDIRLMIQQRNDTSMPNNTFPIDKSKRRSIIGSIDSQLKNNHWRKEFSDAFKKISVISKLKLQMNNQSHHDDGKNELTMSSPRLSSNVLNDEDTPTQMLASDLIDSMLSGCPAALFASTQFLRDEHGKRRAPLLLAMLDITVKPLNGISPFIVDSFSEEPSEDYETGRNDDADDNENISDGNNHAMSSRRTSFSSMSTAVRNKIIEKKNDNTMFKLELEYGIGSTRQKWSVVKSYQEINALHTNLKLVSLQQVAVNKLSIESNQFRKIRLPSFPKFPKNTWRKNHHLEKNGVPIDPGFSNGLRSRMQSRTTLQADTDENNSASSSLIFFDINKIKMKHLQDLIREPDDESQPMYIRLERYLKLLNLALCLRPQANRLCEFYEFSPIGNLLSYENGYQGKEGPMIIRSTAKSQGWRVSHFNAHDFKEMIERHTEKWFLVRHSYITYVSDLCSTTPLDVFLVDSKFKIKCSGLDKRKTEELIQQDVDWNKESSRKFSVKLLITLENSERKLKVICSSEYSLRQWMRSINYMSKSTIWSQVHRFNSFAPVRKNSFCKYLVDGRDYFWALSEALNMAKDVIYIHDWWLSPELYMRRPVNGNQQYRIDRILKKCAESGIKIFIVIYRNVGNTVGTDSLWTKHSMLGLHPNIHLIRSPNQWLQNTYFWAHHEKFVVIDHTIAFMGGIDLCYGRYDTPEHVLRDDATGIKDQNFPGKDYSNARICDFYELDKPFESMYDRNVIPRMPWHDVHMMMVGEPARDLSRHFVQRWNYLLREKRPSRPTPLLTPANDFTACELERSPFFKTLKKRSTCEVQILRSAGNWSLGLKETEKSIQNAYLKLIETSQHYIYIENQFFITTSTWDGVIIENKIGDAIVDRIIRANSEGAEWKAFIIIPLMPGFDSPIDQPEASALRVIMQCQYQSISRGETSIFARLRKLNIDPVQYIQFYSLRKWSTIGTEEKLVTEQLYVHAKLLIVDDRSCIIGSANINERSQLGNRDSEVAAIVRDTDLIKTKMNGEDYYAGRFAWELRQRLMREHLGCDVDLVEIVERQFGRLEKLAKENYRTLHTLDTKKKSSKYNKEDKITSSMIELAYREVFDVDYSSSWSNIYHRDDITEDEQGGGKRGSYVSSSKFGINLEEFMKTTSEVEAYDEVCNVLDSLEEEIGNKKMELPIRNTRGQTQTDPPVPLHSFNFRAGTANLGIRDNKSISADPRLIGNKVHTADVSGDGPDGWNKVTDEFKESVTEQLKDWALKALSSRVIDDKEKSKTDLRYEASFDFLPDKRDIEKYLNCLEISDIKKWDMLKRICYLQRLSYKIKVLADSKTNVSNEENTSTNSSSEQSDNRTDPGSLGELDDDAVDELLSQITPSVTNNEDFDRRLLNLKFVDPYCFGDPLAETFYDDVWTAIALRNTLIFRFVFHCQPDNDVQTWRDYKEFNKLSQEFIDEQNKSIETALAMEKSNESSTKSGSTNSDDLPIPKESDRNVNKGEKLIDVPVNKTVPRDDENEKATTNKDLEEKSMNALKKKTVSRLKMRFSNSLLYGFKQRTFDRHTSRRLLERVHGNLVIFPTEWLAKEVESKNWFYSADRLPPIEIYD